MTHLKTCMLAASLLLTCFIPGAYAGDDTLATVIASRSAEDRARDDARHPAETLIFFRVKPGMAVAEGLPGGGWYTRLLADYLGPDGALYGVNYADRMWPMFSFADPDWVSARIASNSEFPRKVAGFTDNGIEARGFTFEDVPADLNGKIDRVLLIRALHNLNRFEQQAGTRSKALASVHKMLRDDGLVGVVQHRAPEQASDEWADGNRGYLKQSAVIAMFEQAGFKLHAKSEINANDRDQPGAEDIVWRLPPSLRGSDKDPQRREAMLAIGESDRMTLLFQKVSQ